MYNDFAFNLVFHISRVSISKKGLIIFGQKFGNSNHSDIAMPFNRPQMFRDFENLRSIYTFAPEINCTFPN